MVGINMNPFSKLKSLGSHLASYAAKNDIPTKVQENMASILNLAEDKLVRVQILVENEGYETHFEPQFAVVATVKKLMAIIEEQRARRIRK